MDRVLSSSLAICLLAATGTGIYGACGLTKHVITAFDEWGSAGVELHATLTRVNGPHGTLVELDKTILAAKSLEVHADLILAHEERQLSTLDGYTKTLVGKMSSLADHGNKTLDEADQTLAATTIAVNSANNSIQNLEPAEANAAASLADLDTLLRNPQIPDTLSNIDRLTLATAEGTEQLSGTVADLHKMTTKLEHDIDAPKPWYTKVLPFSTDAAGIFACLITKTCL